jgi:hypothetical protein
MPFQSSLSVIIPGPVLGASDYVPGTNRTITVAGANLFRLALVYLGDASQWTRIAALNGLTDPVLAGIMTLQIPPYDPAAGNGGILTGVTLRAGVGYGFERPAPL